MNSKRLYDKMDALEAAITEIRKKFTELLVEIASNGDYSYDADKDIYTREENDNE